ncbi:MAG: NifU family protein [Bacteroidota bacterium]|nr:NifU family protein [Bacteroidota bacterium]
MQPYITVYAEATPNPESIKFVFNDLIVNGGPYDFTGPETTEESPLATALFKFNFVKGVFISQDFVTITKVPEAMWAELIPVLRAFLKEYMAEGSPVVLGKGPGSDEALYNDDDPEAVKKIKEILYNSVRPAIEMDGGAIEFRSFDEGVVTLALKGSCSGCPSSTVTLKSGIETLLKRMVPEVKEVVAEAV